MNRPYLTSLLLLMSSTYLISGCSQKEELLTVNFAPIAESQAVEVLGTQSVEIVLKGSDPDDDPITYKLVNNPEFGVLSGEIPNLVYTPTEDVDRADHFNFIVNDGKLDSKAALVEITVTQFNSTPTVGEDTYDTVGGCRLVASAENGLLSNDADEDGDDLSAILETEPEHGTLTLEADGSFVYVPSLPLASTDSFSYKVSDGTSESEISSVVITIDNDGIIVSTIDDISEADGQCSLREAFEMTNTGLPVDACATENSNKRILFGVPDGRFALQLADTDGDGNQTGDLDIKSEVTLLGCGSDATAIDGNATNRLFHVLEGATFTVKNLSIDNGFVEGYGAGIFNAGSTHLIGVTLLNNHATGIRGDNGSTAGGGGGGGGAGGFGGAIYNDTDATLVLESGTSACMLTANTVTGGGGGNGHANGSVGQGRGGDGAGLLGGLGSDNNGQAGGFGSGGGGGGGTWQGTTFGGLGGFAGGGGGAGARTGGSSGQEGALSIFGGGKGGKGGCSAAPGGGGGAGLGGAIFNHEGSVTITNCHFESNSAIGGPRGHNAYCGVQPEAGLGYGGSIFNYGGIVDVSEASYLDNIADESPDLHDYNATDDSSD